MLIIFHKALIGLSALAAPVGFIGFVWGYILLKDALPLGIWALVGVSYVVLCLGFAAMWERSESLHSQQ